MRSNLVVEGIMLTPNNYTPQVDVHFYEYIYNNGECAYSDDYDWQSIYIELIKGNIIMIKLPQPYSSIE